MAEKKQSTLRRAFLKAKTGTYCTIKQLKALTGWTDTQIIAALEANMDRYNISAEIVYRPKEQGSVRWRGRNIGLFRVEPKRPPAEIDGIIYV